MSNDRPEYRRDVPEISIWWLIGGLSVLLIGTALALGIIWLL